MPDDLLQGEISLTTAQIGVLYAPEANREMLHYLVKRKEAVTAALDPEKARMASSKTATRDSLRYDAKNLERLSTIFALRQAKFGLDEIIKELKSDPFGPEAQDWVPWKMLPPERVSAVNKNNRALLNMAVVRDAEPMLRRAVENGLKAVESVRCSIVLFARDGNLLLRNDWSGLKGGEDPEAEHDQNRIMSESKAEFRELRAAEWAQWSKEPHIGVQPGAQPGKVRSRMQVPIIDKSNRFEDRLV